jgi:hypothetical protein
MASSTRLLLTLALLCGSGALAGCSSDAPTMTTEKTTTTTTGPASPMAPVAGSSTTTTTRTIQPSQ